jgi:hypothetical protein
MTERDYEVLSDIVVPVAALPVLRWVRRRLISVAWTACASRHRWPYRHRAPLTGGSGRFRPVGWANRTTAADHHRSRPEHALDLLHLAA